MGGIGKSRLVTVIIPANNTNPQISFPDQPDLRYARILAIETFTVSDVSASQPDGVTVLSDADLPKVTVTFETNDSDDLQIVDANGKQKYTSMEQAANDKDNPNATGRFRTTSQNLKWIPLVDLHRVQNATPVPFVREIFEFNNTFITWDKSYISMNPVITPGAANAVIFNVYYSFTNIFGGQIRRT